MKKILGTLAIAAVAAASPAYATNGMRMIGFGPVQNSMGGAGAAAPTDAAAAVSNPAGLTDVAPQVDAAVQAFMPSVKYTATWTPDGTNLFEASQTSSRPTDWLPTLGAVFKVSDELTVGVAALGTAGMGVTYEAGSDSLFQGKLMSSYVNGRLAPAVAYKLSDQFSIGLALNLMYAQMKFAAPTPPPPNGFGQIDTPAAASFGYGATLGVSYKPNAMVTIGAAFETESYFQDFSLDVGGGQTLKLKLDQPMVATIGVAIRPVEGLLLALDGQWIAWSTVLGKDKPTTDPNFGFNMNWKDQFVAKLGAQYQATKELAVRAGFNYGKSPVDKEQAFESLLFPAISEMHYTVGAGYDFGKVTVNATFVYSPEAKISGADPAIGIVAYETKMSQTAFELGAVYRF